MNMRMRKSTDSRIPQESTEVLYIARHSFRYGYQQALTDTRRALLAEGADLASIADLLDDLEEQAR